MVTSTKDGYYLTGEDAMNFVYDLLFPNAKSCKKTQEVLKKIEDTIHITNKRDTGFDVVVDGLDLSFLDKEKSRKENKPKKKEEKEDNMDKVKTVAENFYTQDCPVQGDLASKLVKEAYVAGFTRGVERQKAVKPKETTQPWYKKTKDGWEKEPPFHEDLIVTIYDDSGDSPYYYTAPAWCVNEIWIVDNEVPMGTVVAWQYLPKPCDMN